jgi:hypothetical protein
VVEGGKTAGIKRNKSACGAHAHALATKIYWQAHVEHALACGGWLWMGLAIDNGRDTQE